MWAPLAVRDQGTDTFMGGTLHPCHGCSLSHWLGPKQGPSHKYCICIEGPAGHTRMFEFWGIFGNGQRDSCVVG